MRELNGLRRKSNPNPRSLKEKLTSISLRFGFERTDRRFSSNMGPAILQEERFTLVSKGQVSRTALKAEDFSSELPETSISHN